VRHRDQGGVLALAECVARLRAYRGRCRGACGRRSGTGALDAGVHVSLVVAADEQHVVVALEHAGQAGKPDVDGAAVAALPDDANVRAALGAHRGRDTGSHRGRVAE